MKIVIERRGILRGPRRLGPGGAAGADVPHAPGRGARGAVAVPKVVFFYTPCGLEPNLWHPDRDRQDLHAEEAVRAASRLPVRMHLHGRHLDVPADRSSGRIAADAGGRRQGRHDARSAARQPAEELSSPFSSVQLGIQSRISKGGTPTVPHPHFTRVSLKEEVYAEDNPLAAFARLFGQTER